MSYRNELDDIYIFCNQTMNRASKVYKEAEKIVTEAGMTLHTVTNNELLSLVKKNKSIAEFYFSQRKIKEINYYENRVTCISFSPDGRSLASGSSDKTVRIRDLKNDSERKLGSHDDEVRCVSYSSDGRYLASGSYDKTIRVCIIDLSSSNTNDKSLRLLTLKIIDKGKELCNIRFVANDKHMLNNSYCLNKATGKQDVVCF